MTVSGTHPFGEALARKLFGIESVSPEQARRMAHKATQFALDYVVSLEEERDRLRGVIEYALDESEEPASVFLWKSIARSEIERMEDGDE